MDHRWATFSIIGSTMRETLNEFVPENMVFLNVNENTARKKHLNKRKMPWRGRRPKSRKKVYKELEKKRTMLKNGENNIENLVREIVHEENVIQKPCIKPISMRELVSTLAGEVPDTEFLVDLESEMQEQSTQELIEILEDEVSLDDLCRQARRTKDSRSPIARSVGNGDVTKIQSDCYGIDYMEPPEKQLSPNLEMIINNSSSAEKVKSLSKEDPIYEKMGEEISGDDGQRADHLDSDLDDCGDINEGRRCIVDFPFVLEEFHKALDEHLENGRCKFRNVQLIEQQREGFKTIFHIQCSQCRLIMPIRSEPSETEFMDINHAAVCATITTGTGLAQLTESSAAMGIFSPSGPQFRIYQATVVDALIKAAEECVIEAGKLEVELALQRGDVREGIPCTWVVCDGAYAKRSYITSAHNSLSGVGVIVGFHSRQVLFFGIKNVYCSLCSRAEKLGVPPKSHKCFKNFDGSATSMETEAILDGFKCSIEQHGLIYTHIIADGDSSVFNAITMFSPYRELNIFVKKIECYNHLLRRLILLLKEIGKDDRTLITWRKLIENNCLRIRTDIMAAVDYRRRELVSEQEKVERLRKDCINVPYHVFGDHGQCDKYYCTGKAKENEVNHVPMMKQMGIFQKIENAFDRVICNCDSLIKKLNNNLCEICNALHAKTIAGKRINFTQRGSYTARVCAAVIQFNNQDVLQRIAKAMSKKPLPIVKSLERRRKAANDAKKLRRHLSKISEGSVRKKPVLKPKGTKKKKVQYGVGCEQSDLPESEIERKKTILMEELSKWQKNREDIEVMTRSGGNPDLRKLISTKTISTEHFGRICKMQASTSRHELIKDMLCPSTRSTARNQCTREQLNVAKDRLFEELGITFADSGMVIDCEDAYVVASPGGIIDDERIVEFFFPDAARDEFPADAIENGIAKLDKLDQRDDITQLRRNHNWYYNIQGSLHITQRTWCLFVLATNKGIHWVGVDKEEDFWQNYIAQHLRKFYDECLLFEIVDSRFSRGMTARNPPDVAVKMIAKKLKKRPIFDNGLFRDREYYIFNELEDFIMTRYNCSSLAPIIGRESLLLYSADYARCAGTAEISSDLMDSYMIIKSQTTWLNTYFIPSNHTGYILGDMSNQNHGDDWHMYTFDWIFTGKVFLPYVRQGHWCLLVLDIEEQTITHIDPRMHGKTDRSTEALIQFQKYLDDCRRRKKNQLCDITWRIVYEFEKRPMQRDTYNCGIFVMYYMDCIAQCKPFDLKFDPDAYRLYLQDLLLQESQPMNEICLNCENDQSRSECVVCISCKRWAHRQCKNAPACPKSSCTMCRVYFTL